MNTPQFSRHLESHDELLRLARQVAFSPVPEKMDKETTEFSRASRDLAYLVLKALAEDEHGLHTA